MIRRWGIETLALDNFHCFLLFRFMLKTEIMSCHKDLHFYVLECIVKSYSQKALNTIEKFFHKNI